MLTATFSVLTVCLFVLFSSIFITFLTEILTIKNCITKSEFPINSKIYYFPKKNLTPFTRFKKTC